MYSANGSPTPGLFAQLANDAARSVAFRDAQTLGPEFIDKGQQKPNFGANSIQRRRATYDRFILTTFLCTLQQLTSTTGLIQPLQHSILGVWLTLTQAGFTPARQQDLASPHVQLMVRRYSDAVSPDKVRIDGFVPVYQISSTNLIILAVIFVGIGFR